MKLKSDKLSRHLYAIHDRLYAGYGDLGCPLRHETPFQLLIAVILSAQCRDDRVNEVTPELFRRYPDAAAMSQASEEEISSCIQTLGLYRNKARSIVLLSRKLMDENSGELPQDMDGLTALPGVGRKSANVVLGNAFNIPGFPVDTHVQRLLKHLGAATAGDTPEKIEQTVCSRIKPELWTNFSHLLITHGRQVCHARKPDCPRCIIRDLCPGPKN